MAKISRQESMDRQRFAIDVWKRLWKNLAPGNKTVPATAVNDEIFKKYKAKMRGDMVYRLREQAIQELKAEGFQGLQEPLRKIRKNSDGAQPEQAIPHVPMPYPPSIDASGQPIVQARRGRPPGSLNKPKEGAVSVPGAIAAKPVPGKPRPMNIHQNTGGFPQVITGLAGLGPTQAVERVFSLLETGLRVEHSGVDYVLVNRV